MSSWIAITGGSGYVGSHIAAALKLNTSYKTLVIDNRIAQLPHTWQFADQFIDKSYNDPSIANTLATLNPSVLIHCAASSLVGPSMTDPAAYYANNVVGIVNLLDTMRQQGVVNLVFSSSSSVYGNSDEQLPSKEDEHLDPISPYGTTKMIGEHIIRDYCDAYGMNAICFRYFNAVGASPLLDLGQEPGATHLIARVMESLIDNTEFVINGDDWPTVDGTCVRDYVHVRDIADAHVLGAKWLLANPGFHVMNIGSGSGQSIKQIIAAVEYVTGRKINTQIGTKRAGDPAWRMADIARISTTLNWKPNNDIVSIVSDAYDWYNSNTFKKLRC